MKGGKQTLGETRKKLAILYKLARQGADPLVSHPQRGAGVKGDEGIDAIATEKTRVACFRLSRDCSKGKTHIEKKNYKRLPLG